MSLPMSPMSSPAAPPTVPRLQLRVQHVRGMPMIAAKVWLRGGARAEEIPGQALVSGRLLTEGTEQHTWQEIAALSEDRGMLLNGSSSYEALSISVQALAEDWQEALAWLAELTFTPVFPTDRLTWIVRQAAAELESMLDQPELKTSQAFLEQLYAPHPYSRSLYGTPASLERLSACDCAAFHRQALAWGGLVVVTGELDEAAVSARVRELFAPLLHPRDAATVVPTPAQPAPELPPYQEIIAGEADQAHVFIGHLTVPRNHPASTALELIGVVLGAGAGLSGRLPERIREREGLAYSTQIATRSGAGLDPGRLVAYVGTSPKTAAQAERAVREELERLLTHGITDEEFSEARAYLIGRDPLTRQTARQWADLLAEAEFYGLPSDRPDRVIEELRSLTRAEVEAIARQFIDPSALRVTVGLPRIA